jgi:HEAT repeat protein
MLRNKFFIFVLIIVLLFSFSNSFAKKDKVLNSKVTELLEKYPAQSSEERDQLSAELLQFGTDGILAICHTLLPPGKGNDTDSRFALHGLSIYANREGAEQKRMLYAKALIKGLKSAKDREVKAFLIRQIQLVGKDESVKTLSKYLKDERLCEPATQALYSIGSKKAKKVLVKALGSVKNQNRATIIKALGDLRCSSAAKKLLKYVNSKNEKVRQTTLYALANIGDPSAEEVISRLSISVSAYERNTVPNNYLLYAQRLGESGNKKKATQICRQMIRSYSSNAESNIATSALAVLVDILGKNALDDLLKTMDSFNEQLHAGALELADKIPGEAATAKWIKRMGEVTPNTKAKIVSMLGSRGDVTAIPILIESMQDSDPHVRLAAIFAVTKLKKNDSVHHLLYAMKEADERELKVIQTSLLTLDTDVVVNASAKTIHSLPATAQISLLEILSKRRAKTQIEVVWDLTSNEDPDVRLAAISAFEKLATENDLPRLVQLFQQTENEEEIVALQKAIAVSVADIPDSVSRLNEFLKIFELLKQNKRAGLFDSFAQIGNPNGLELIVLLTKNRPADIRNSAIRTLANWTKFEASTQQIELVKILNDTEQKTQLLRGYLRLTRDSEIPDYKKVELLKDVMTAITDTKNKKLVLRGLSEIISIESVKYIASFMNVAETKTYAAMMIRRIALPNPDGDNGLSTPELISILKKSASIIDNKIEQEKIYGYLNTLLMKFGFKQIFNEENLEGWKGLVESPPKRAKMSTEELNKKQVIADSIKHAHWKVQKDGVLFFDGEGQSLCTAKDYQDFEMLVDWKIQKEGDSGIYLRGSPQVQIWDPAQWPEGSGGLYNNKKNPSKPLVKADNPIGEWNTFRIIMIGEKVTVYLNDVLVVDNVVMENYWERDKSIYPTGQIELQSHHSPLYFRNIYIREIKERKNFRGLSSREKEEGFELLFNGKDMTGWVGDTTGYSTENGKIVLHPEKSSGNLYTENEYSDFVLRFEFKLTPGANNGLGIRTPSTGNAAYEGMELQILENTHPKYDKLKPYQFHGSVYGVVPAKRGFLNPVGKWNFQEVIAEGNEIKVILNGETIVRVNIEDAGANGTLDGIEHPGLKRTKGHIGFLGHGDHVEFRNLRIREIE